MSFENLEVTTDGGIATVTITRPAALNALNAPTLDEIESCIEGLGEDAAVRVVILTGAGPKAFVAGADIAEMKGLDRNAARALSERGQRLFSRIENLGKPVIAAINGFALGGGCELALAASVRIAATNAKLGLPEVKLGLIPGYGGTQRLARLVGPGHALELILSGEFVSAERAAEIGLVNRVVAPEALLAECRALADRFLLVGPVAARKALEAVNRGLGEPLARGLAIEAELFGALFETKDAAEGIAAFLEKRPPSFRGW
jgi:enoyl-CoA hydratase